MEKQIESVLPDDCTLDSLLDAIESKLGANKSIGEKQRREWMGHFGWAANVAAKALKSNRAKLTVQQMMNSEEKITRYTSQQPVSNSAKVMLRCYRRGMIRHAKDLGWSPGTFALGIEWQLAKDAAKGVPAALSIILWAVERKLHMSKFSDSELDEWGKESRRKGRTYRYVISRKSDFRSAIRNAGLQAVFPLLSTAIVATFRVGARSLPLWLRSLIAVIIWNMRAEARMDDRRFPITVARGLVLRFRELFGYAIRVSPNSIESIEELLSESLIRDYILFLHNEQWKRASIVSGVNRIANAMRFHPILGKHDYTWIKACILELPEDDDTNIDPDSDGTEVLLDDLAAIPKKISARRRRLAGDCPRAKAWLILKEFVIFLLVTHPFPSRCITACRIDYPRRNMFLGSKPRDNAPFALLPRTKQDFARGSDTPFWQFDFSPEHLQLGRYARGPLVTPLVQKLKQYLTYREELVRGKADPGTLLVNFAGQPFECGEFSKLVADTCLEYCGVRVPPSAFRRKFLFDWLTEYPGDEDNLGAILWISSQSVKVEFERWSPNYAMTSNHRERRWIHRCRSYWT